MKKHRYIYLILAITCVILLLFICQKATKPSTPRTWQDFYDLGQNYLLEENYEEAIVAFTDAITLESNRAELYVARADAYVAWAQVEGVDAPEEKLSLASSDYEKALGLQKNSSSTEENERIKEKLEEIRREEALPESTQTSDSPLNIVCRVLELSSLAEKTTLQYVRGDDTSIPSYIPEGLFSTTLQQPAVIFADQHDYDNDGEDEILSVILEGKDRADISLRLCMLEQSQDGWQVEAETNVTSENDSFGIYQIDRNPQNITIYTDNQNQIFLESVSYSRFGDGVEWELLTYQYANAAFSQVHTPIFFAESYDLEPYFTMNPANAIDDESRMYAQEFVDAIHELGLNPQEINLEISIPDTDGSLRKLAKLLKKDNTTEQTLQALYSQPAGSTGGEILLNCTTYEEDE